MKTIAEFFKENVEKVDFDKVLNVSKFKMNLNEAPEDDMGGDDLDDDGPADFGGDDFADDDSPNSDFGSDEAGKTDTAPEEETTGEEQDDHEEDPDFTNTINNPDSPVLGTPAAQSLYDSDGIFKSIKGVIEALPKEELVEIEKVKTCLELIFSGKKLKPEDLDFDNIQNAVFLLSKILESVDEKTRNYAKLKLKMPIQLSRDKDKLELASKTKDLERKRDTILGIDKL